MAHCADDVVFRSVPAEKVTGNGVGRGKPALRAYRKAALDRAPELAFTVKPVLRGHDMMVILHSNHRGGDVAETRRCGPDGRVCYGSACQVRRTG